MGIDKETKMEATICIDNNTAMLRMLEDKNIEFCGEEENKKKPQLWFSEELGSISTEEYYYDDEQKKIIYTGNATTPHGDVFISVYIPLSDTVLIDILHDAIKRLNKLKTAIETLR